MKGIVRHESVDIVRGAPEKEPQECQDSWYTHVVINGYSINQSNVFKSTGVLINDEK